MADPIALRDKLLKNELIQSCKTWVDTDSVVVSIDKDQYYIDEDNNQYTVILYNKITVYVSTIELLLNYLKRIIVSWHARIIYNMIGKCKINLYNPKFVDISNHRNSVYSYQITVIGDDHKWYKPSKFRLYALITLMYDNVEIRLFNSNVSELAISKTNDDPRLASAIDNDNLYAVLYEALIAQGFIPKHRDL